MEISKYFKDQENYKRRSTSRTSLKLQNSGKFYSLIINVKIKN